jgi:hypothetical protein
MMSWTGNIEAFEQATARFNAVKELLEMPDNQPEWEEAGRLLREIAGSVTLDDREAAEAAIAKLNDLLDGLLEGTA